MKILTANRLTDGEAVWLSSDHIWVERLEGAHIARDPAGEETLDLLGKQSAARNEVLDVNLIDVEVTSAGIRPIRLRERIRAAGPTNHLDHGKQAELAD
ncbi:MAG: DUF2849 domain-containing protein [Mesorhizobium sp.]